MGNIFPEQKFDFDFIGEGYALKKTSDKDIVHLYKNGRSEEHTSELQSH